ncbi:Nnf1-domain-containing protein [Pseudovirgaria hyperparasitica]|uniref:Nnf1-domain-containing protein n=1 Tax=Pseudovirgaria hyperparasitica TaxID=470096 RepID=A0A6A6W0X8_9PEZI|nr:Nnf1-domain-containing protein [Pseudovirgaria hyperparasitica]KAF2756552.1 Nnf1-domain-containing protein [Pseudovirgaria hyperparasitica]
MSDYWIVRASYIVRLGIFEPPSTTQADVGDIILAPPQPFPSAPRSQNESPSTQYRHPPPCMPQPTPPKNKNKMPSAAPNTRSQSPETAPPIATAPGPRAQALQNIFTNALDATFKKCNYSNFADCFPTTAKYKPENLDALHRDFVARLGEQCKTEFDKIVQERNVTPALNALDDLLADARKRKDRAATSTSTSTPNASAPIPPHTLSPSTLFHAHLHPFLSTHASSLTTEIADVQAANKALFDDVKGQREEIAALLRGLEERVKELEHAAEIIEEGGKGVDVDIEGVEERLGSRDISHGRGQRERSMWTTENNTHHRHNAVTTEWPRQQGENPHTRIKLSAMSELEYHDRTPLITSAETARTNKSHEHGARDTIHQMQDGNLKSSHPAII